MSAHGQHPDAAGRFGRYLAVQGLLQAAKHQVGEHLSDHMASGDRTGPLGMNDAAFRGDHFERGQGAGVVRDLGRDQAFEAEDRISVAVAFGRIDAHA